MAQIKYAGPRPYISQHGISYKNGKEDKYVYIQNAIELLKDIDHDYEYKKSYSSTISVKKLTQDKIDQILEQYEKDLKQKIDQEVQRYKEKISHEIEHIKTLKRISDIEKDVWIKNIKLMEDYRIQRAINKIYYFHCINDIKNIILKQNIKRIVTPFNERFWHILETLQGVLESDKRPIHTSIIEYTTNDDQRVIELDIAYHNYD